MLTPSSKICRKTNSLPAEEKYWAYVNQITERIATCACDDQSLVMRGSINKYYTSSTLVPQKYSFEWYNLYNRRPVRGQIVCFLLNPKRCTQNWRWWGFYPLEKRLWFFDPKLVYIRHPARGMLFICFSKKNNMNDKFYVV